MHKIIIWLYIFASGVSLSASIAIYVDGQPIPAAINIGLSIICLSVAIIWDRIKCPKL
jgi:hypothetical protein